MALNLMKLMHSKEQVRIITDMAFDHADQDESGSIDRRELTVLLQTVAVEMEVTPPTEEDVYSALKALDEDASGYIEKDEFFRLVVLVLQKMANDEIFVENECNASVNLQH